MLETNKDDKRHEIAQLDKFGSKLGYNAGFFLGAVTVGLLAGLVLGGIAIVKYSKSKFIKNQTEKVNERIKHNKISLKDLDKLAVGEKISSQECTHIAMFVDGLEQKVGSLKDGQQVGNRYVFTKTIDPNGVINYTVQDAKFKQVAASFNLSRNGEITVQSRDKFKEIGDLNEFVIENADKVGVNLNDDLSLYTDEANRVEIIEREIQVAKTSIESGNQIDLDEASNQLSLLKAEAKAIADRIESAEAANDQESDRHPENTLLGIKVSRLVDKLVGLDQQIDGLASNLRGELHHPHEVRVSPVLKDPQQADSKTYSGNQSFSEDEYPNLPADLNDLQTANGQPITISELESLESELGLEQ